MGVSRAGMFGAIHSTSVNLTFNYMMFAFLLTDTDLFTVTLLADKETQVTKELRHIWMINAFKDDLYSLKVFVNQGRQCALLAERRSFVRVCIPERTLSESEYLFQEVVNNCV